MEEIIDYENRLFHEEEYDFEINILPLGSSNNLLEVKGQILYSYWDYKAELLLPKEYQVKIKNIQKGNFVKEGYDAYILSDFRRKYRDHCSYDDLIISPESPYILKQSIIVVVLLDKEIRYSSDIYSIETKNKKIVLTKSGEGKGKKQKENRCKKAFL